MTVKGWLIVGSNTELPSPHYMGECDVLPNAGHYRVGSWFAWHNGPTLLHTLIVVCIEVPL